MRWRGVKGGGALAAEKRMRAEWARIRGGVISTTADISKRRPDDRLLSVKGERDWLTPAVVFGGDGSGRIRNPIIIASVIRARASYYCTHTLPLRRSFPARVARPHQPRLEEIRTPRTLTPTHNRHHIGWSVNLWTNSPGVCYVFSFAAPRQRCEVTPCDFGGF